MQISNKDILIRRATQHDATLLTTWWNDGKIMAHAGFPHGIHTSVEEVIQQLITDNKKRLIIEYQHQPIGEMCYFSHGSHCVEIGIKICVLNLQNHGLGKQALKLLISYLFSKGYKRIILSTDLSNKRAQHVYETLGFQIYDIRHDYWQDPQGQMHSAIFYELFPSTFISTKKL